LATLDEYEEDGLNEIIGEINDQEIGDLEENVEENDAFDELNEPLDVFGEDGVIPEDNFESPFETEIDPETGIPVVVPGDNFESPFETEIDPENGITTNIKRIIPHPEPVNLPNNQLNQINMPLRPVSRPGIVGMQTKSFVRRCFLNNKVMNLKDCMKKIANDFMVIIL
jgi:hypothetical protein